MSDIPAETDTSKAMSRALKAEGFRFCGCDHSDVRGQKSGWHIIDVTYETYPVLQTCGADRACQGCLVGFPFLGISGQDEDDIGEVALSIQELGSLDQHALSLPACEARRLQHYALILAYPPCRSQRGDAVMSNLLGIE